VCTLTSHMSMARRVLLMTVLVPSARAWFERFGEREAFSFADDSGRPKPVRVQRLHGVA